jgi:hypothetical protein
MSKSNGRLVQGAVAWAVAIAALAAAPQTSMAQENSQGTQRGIIAILKPGGAGGHKHGAYTGVVTRPAASAKAPGPQGRTRLRDPGPGQAPGATGMINPGPQQAPTATRLKSGIAHPGGVNVPAGVNR